jgi:putative phosphotransacetylase
MGEGAPERLIRNIILTVFAKQGKYLFPVAISARHVHLSKNNFEHLFGLGKTMTRQKDLSQPGQYACEETVEIAGPKGSIKKVRVLGPARNETQVEISVSDSFALGIRPEIRMSGNIEGTPGCTIIGPAGRLTVPKGVIVAARHVHLSEEQAAVYKLKEGDLISVKTPAPREGIIGNIAVRIGKDFDLEVHLDTDEANGNGILCGTILEGACMEALPAESPVSVQLGGSQAAPGGVTKESSPLDLVTERDVNNAFARGEKTLYCTAKGFITPAAADRAKEKGITLCKLQG